MAEERSTNVLDKLEAVDLSHEFGLKLLPYKCLRSCNRPLMHNRRSGGVAAEVACHVNAALWWAGVRGEPVRIRVAGAAWRHLARLVCAACSPSARGCRVSRRLRA